MVTLVIDQFKREEHSSKNVSSTSSTIKAAITIKGNQQHNFFPECHIQVVLTDSYHQCLEQLNNLITVEIAVLFSVRVSVQRNVKHTSTMVLHKETASLFTEILQLKMESCLEWMATTSFIGNVMDSEFYFVSD